MIRSAKVTLKYSNKNKLEKIDDFLIEYRGVVRDLIDEIWTLDKIPSLLPKSITSRISSWLSARAIQCAGKQASGIVRGTQIKQKQRKFVIEKLRSKGEFKKANELQKIFDKTRMSKPEISDIPCELDERFVKIENGNNSFDGWIKLGSLGKKLKFQIPFKKHKHLNKLISKGKLKKGIRLTNNSITLMVEIPDTKRTKGKILGIDIGKKTTLSCSDGQTSNQCPHGHNYDSLCAKLARKKKGSKSFQKTVKHRSNYLRFVVNQLNLDNVAVINRENIKNLRKFSNVSRRMAHWNYSELFDALDNKLELQGVLVNKVDPMFTSQRCSSCGWTRKLNRHGKGFKCGACEFSCDADLNASINLSLYSSPIGDNKRFQSCNNIEGFYWNFESRELIVPNV